jgi:hypothetical protein
VSAAQLNPTSGNATALASGIALAVIGVALALAGTGKYRSDF